MFKLLEDLCGKSREGIIEEENTFLIIVLSSYYIVIKLIIICENRDGNMRKTLLCSAIAWYSVQLLGRVLVSVALSQNEHNSRVAIRNEI